MMFSIFGALAEYERNLIRERVCAGLQTAKARGVKLGRPSVISDNTIATIKVLREKGESIKKICKLVGCGVGTYYSVIQG
jgi:DNA invertase Pin-like site-specific DNA recombinase